MMRVLALAALLAAVAPPAAAGEPSHVVPNRTAVGPFVSPRIDIHAAQTAPKPAGPAGLWIGNSTLMDNAPAQVPPAPQNGGQ
jgi:hypothetical protein